MNSDKVILRKVERNHYQTTLHGDVYDVIRRNDVENWKVLRNGEKWAESIGSLITVRFRLSQLPPAPALSNPPDASGGHTWDELPDF